ncbi:ABC transporter permease [Micromonospora ureilytica]|uniref:ABC transporter permease n=1 Tax=Micromonospora ureilytica TaxID=709868 RepID=UPI00403A002E
MNKNVEVIRRLGISQSRVRPFDLVREAALGIGNSPGRSLLTALGTILGAAAFVCTLGLTSTMNNQVSNSFDLRRATEVLVQPENGQTSPDWQRPEQLERLRSLNGVEVAGCRILLPERGVRRAFQPEGTGVGVRIAGVDPGALGVVEPELQTGRVYDQFHESGGARVVLLPGSIATRLGSPRIGSAVLIDERAFTLIGVFNDVQRRPELLLSAVIPFSTAERMATANDEPERDVLVKTSAGAAQLIGRQAPLSLAPTKPDSLRSIAPPDPKALRREVESNTRRVAMVLSVTALVLGTISIGNAATSSVSTRTHEIGLRRAIGGRPRHIFLQLVGETTAIGALGGLMGVALGVAVTSAACLSLGWTPVLDLRMALVASATSALSGAFAGLLPAVRATRISPVNALQR